MFAGCGLISSDVTNFNLDIHDKTFTIDASRWQVDPMAAMTFLGMTCDPAQQPPNVCSSAVAQACAMGCAGSCDMTSRKCDLGLVVAVHQTVDLQMEQPELNTINNEPVIKVAIDSLRYAVTSNTLNVATPEMKIYVAPMSVMDPSDPMAKLVGTVAPVPAMMTVAETDMVYADGGKQALIDTMSTYKTPFNVIVGSTLMVKQGDPAPTGKLEALVHIKAHAGL